MTSDVFLECQSPGCGLAFVGPTGTQCPVCASRTEQVAERYPNTVLRGQARRKLTVILDNIRSAHNVGVMLRTCEAFGVDHVYLCGITAPATNRKVAKAALGAELRVPTSWRPNAAHVVTWLKTHAGTISFGLENTATATSLYDFKPVDNMALVVGNEVAGIAPATLAATAGCLAIPMVGEKNSLNVGHAAAIALAAICAG